MAKAKKSDAQTDEDKEKMFRRRMLEGRYRQRFTIAKEGKRAQQLGDFRNMVLRYTDYLRILAETYEARSIYELKPELFDKKKDVAELLLISQVYWELAKIYDQSDRVIDKLRSCLSQFVLFTSNQDYQSLNTEIVRKDIRKCRFKHEKIFKQSLESIYKDSRNCYVITHFSHNVEVVADFRNFKEFLWSSVPYGSRLVAKYYQYSPALIAHSHKSIIVKKLLHGFFLAALATRFLYRWKFAKKHP
jgi:hypothetical protein